MINYRTLDNGPIKCEGCGSFFTPVRIDMEYIYDGEVEYTETLEWHYICPHCMHDNEIYWIKDFEQNSI